MDIKQIFSWLTDQFASKSLKCSSIDHHGWFFFFAPWFILKTNCCSYFLCLLKSARFKCSMCNLHSEIISSCNDLCNVLSPAEFSLSLIPEVQELWDEHGWCLQMALQGLSVSTLSLCNGIFSCCWALQLFLYFNKQAPSLFWLLVAFASLVQSRHRWEEGNSSQSFCQEYLGTRSGELVVWHTALSSPLALLTWRRTRGNGALGIPA